ncbi:hypothetical protein TPAR_07008 [Tolypocladium paradoxum]|uniref:Uncharacterized protein n=1 Tax=Tolypocladium paradoxum TaxID=94208 RepID=A0A2S4KRF9_9HYPO|nr:hypothetical protein TPAR_07008 [Tolypocladium paradoxum]
MYMKQSRFHIASHHVSASNDSQDRIGVCCLWRDLKSDSAARRAAHSASDNRNISRTPLSASFRGIGISPASGMPGLPTGPMFCSTRTLSARVEAGVGVGDADDGPREGVLAVPEGFDEDLAQEEREVGVAVEGEALAEAGGGGDGLGEGAVGVGPGGMLELVFHGALPESSSRKSPSRRPCRPTGEAPRSGAVPRKPVSEPQQLCHLHPIARPFKRTLHSTITIVRLDVKVALIGLGRTGTNGWGIAAAYAVPWRWAGADGEDWGCVGCSAWALFLAADEADYATGQKIVVDGGITGSMGRT